MDQGVGLALIGIALLVARLGRTRKAIKARDHATYGIPDVLAEGKQKVGVDGSQDERFRALCMTQQVTAVAAYCLVPQVKDLNLCAVLMMNDSRYPVWLVLVPRQVSLHPVLASLTLLMSMLRVPAHCRCSGQAGLTEIIDLSRSDQRRLWEEVGHCCELVRQHFACDKLNVAAIGNVVRLATLPY